MTEIQPVETPSSSSTSSQIDRMLENIDYIEVFSLTDLMLDRIEELRRNSAVTLDDSSDNQSNSYKNIIHRPSRPRVNPLPRILKRDIRRQYAAMLCNVMNSYDDSLISSFFLRFFHEHLCMTHHCPASPINHIELRGRDLISEFHINLLKTSPDKVLRLWEVKIRQSEDAPGRSEVFAQFSVQHTSMFKANPGLVAQAMRKNHQRTEKAGAGDGEGDEEIELNDADRSPILQRKKKRKHSPSSDASSFRMEEHFSRWKEPVPFQVQGVMVLAMDEDKRIVKMVCVPMTMGFVTAEGGLIPFNGDPGGVSLHDK